MSESAPNQTQEGIQTTAGLYTTAEYPTKSEQAYQELIAGNRRFVNDNPAPYNSSRNTREALAQYGQHPLSAIVSCSDSRVPPELVFDQSLGDLFVVRVAGNVLDQTGFASLEYAIEHLRVPLIVVMGHEQCGAVTSTVKTLSSTLSSTDTSIQKANAHSTAAKNPDEQAGNLAVLSAKIRPAVFEAQSLGLSGSNLVEKSVELNIRNVKQAIESNPIVHRALVIA